MPERASGDELKSFNCAEFLKTVCKVMTTLALINKVTGAS